MTNALVNSPFRGLGGVKVFLIGFMGSGKTYWGKIWARQTGMAFYDLDSVIEAEEQKSIAEMFEKKGEGYFRKKETAVLHSFAEKKNCIIACGGGTPCFHDNMQWMNTNGYVVYLMASPQYIFERVIAGKNKRPLIKKINEAELLFYIEKLLKEREPFYKQATCILPVDELDENSLSALQFNPRPASPSGRA